jgi:predicted DNA-binding transcriptional regulator YafY
MSDRINSASRRLKLITLLQSRKYLTVDEIANEFDISRRTVFRDMNILAEMNIPVISDRDRGYSFSKTHTIPPLMFNERELSTLIVGLNFLKGQVDHGLSSDARNVEMKIQSVLPNELKAFMQTVSQKVVLFPYRSDVAFERVDENWFLLLTAINQSKSIQCEYTSKSENNTTTRIIDPYLLVYYTDHWDLIGHCHSTNSLRTFVLQRVNNVSINHASFVNRRGLSTDAIIHRPTDKDQDILLQADASVIDLIRLSLPAKIAKLEPWKEGYRVQFVFDNIRWLNKWLLQFGDKITIVQPTEMIADRKILLQELLDSTK